MPRLPVIEGARYGHLTIIKEVPRLNGERAIFVRCDCGTEKVVLFHNVRKGYTSSCGCKWRIGTHGGWRSPAWKSWAKLYGRCLNQSNSAYSYYGGRGIKIDPRWREFANFLEDMGERPPGMTLERIDTNGDYTKSNCRWASRAEQMRNTRRTKFVILEGETLCIQDAAAKLGIPSWRIWSRIQRKKVSHQQAVDYYAAKGPG